MKEKKCVKNKPNGKCDGFKLEGVINGMVVTIVEKKMVT